MCLIAVPAWTITTGHPPGRAVRQHHPPGRGIASGCLRASVVRRGLLRARSGRSYGQKSASTRPGTLAAGNRIGHRDSCHCLPELSKPTTFPPGVLPLSARTAQPLTGRMVSTAPEANSDLTVAIPLPARTTNGAGPAPARPEVGSRHRAELVHLAQLTCPIGQQDPPARPLSWP